MPSIRVTKGHFDGSGRLYGKDGLSAIVRGIAIDHARIKVQAASIPDLTDNTTGVAQSGGLVDLNASPAIFNATSAGGVTTAALNTSLGKIADLQKTLANSVNAARALLGLPLVVTTDGTQAAANTLPALDKTGTAGSGNSAPTNASVRKAFSVVKDNQRKLARAVREVTNATGDISPKNGFKGSVPSDLNLSVKGTVAASTSGSGSVAKANVDAFLTGVANNYATLAAAWNTAMTQASANSPLHVVAA